MKLKVKYCVIHDVEEMTDDKSKRQVTLMLNEEDFFEMLDSVNPKNIVKYLDLRFVNHREAPVINIMDAKDRRFCIKNKRKLNRCLSILDSINNKEKI